MNLHELTQEQNEILKLVQDGDLTEDEVKDHLESLTEDREKKDRIIPLCYSPPRGDVRPSYAGNKTVKRIGAVTQKRIAARERQFIIQYGRW